MESESIYPLLYEFRQLRREIEFLISYYTAVKCRACGSYLVVPIRITEKRVRFLCKECGEEFQVSKEKLEKIRKGVTNGEEV